MPLQKLQFKPGVNRERSRYSNEGGWYECDKIRFRQGLPEKIGGWIRLSDNTFQGVCRSLFTWTALDSTNYLGVGTNLKFYTEDGSGTYTDITPLRTYTYTLSSNPITTDGSTTTVVVSDTTTGLSNGDTVLISGVDADVGGVPVAELNKAHEISNVVASTSFEITVTTASTSVTSGGGTAVKVERNAVYLLGTDPITTAASGSTLLYITDTTGGFQVNDFVTISGATGPIDGIPASEINTEHQIVDTSGNDLHINVTTTATTGGVSGGGSAVQVEYQVNVGYEVAVPVGGWGAGQWNEGSWGTGGTSQEDLRLWNQANFGEDLIFGVRGGCMYYWDSSAGGRGVDLRFADPLLAGIDAPVAHNHLLISDISRFTFAFGTNAIGSTTLDPMLVRWSNQEDPFDWEVTDSSGNPTQAGDLVLARGSKIVAVAQARQEILVWTDTTLYSLQYIDADIAWGSQILGENITTISHNCVAYANGTAYWMGVDKFYVYNGEVNTLVCDLRRYIFEDIAQGQYDQVFASTNERYHEIWWFYCSEGSTTVDKYVVYNYVDNIWYYGNMARTAWTDSGTSLYPLAATYNNKIVLHEIGSDDLETSTTQPISAHILSSEFDLDDGHNYMFAWRMIPDVTFEGSSASSPSVTMTLYPLKNSGSGYNSPRSEGGNSSATVTRSVSTPVEAYTDQIYLRVRGRQLAMKIESSGEGVQWQLGTPRIDLRPDGRRG